MPLLASRVLPLGAKGRLYSGCVLSIMLYGSETWPIKEKDVIRLERNDTRIVRLMFNVRPEEKISGEKLRTQLKLKQHFKDGKLQWFGHLERMEDSAGLVNV